MRKYRVPLAPKPQKTYSITIINTGERYEVDPEKIPYSRHGIPGSVLEIISAQTEGGIEHACGGVQACSTCHIVVEKGLESCNETSEREEDYLDQTPGLTLQSRLACCCVPDGSMEIQIRIPNWNKNEVKENL